MEVMQENETKSVNEMELMKANEDGRLEINFEVLTSSTSPEFAEFVRAELYHESVERLLVEFNVESRPGSGRNSIIQMTFASLSLIVDWMCYTFTWTESRHNDGHIRQQNNTNKMPISSAKKFAAAFQNLGK